MDAVGAGVEVGVGEVADGGAGDGEPVGAAVAFGDDAGDAEPAVGGGDEGAAQGGAVEVVHGEEDFLFGGIQQGEDVGFETAARDWFQNYAKAWHENRMQKMLQMQREEISRYKWIESERARQDLGRSAVEEWVHKHAADWRVNWEASNLDDEDV